MKYSIGLDFGTLSGRALLVEVSTGKELASVAMNYPHAVMDTALPDGTPLGVDWALQHPQDWLDVTAFVVPAVLKEAGVSPADVVGIGLDFTTCTWLPATADGTPLCLLPEFSSRPGSWPKLWKHHAAQDQANRVNALAMARKEKFLDYCGGKVSSEWVIPKTWQTLEEDPDIYEAADVFVEACDWLSWQLTGNMVRNSCMLGYKANWNKRDGYPSREFFRELDPRMENILDTKLKGEVMPLGSRAGVLNEKGAALTGLLPDTAVAVGIADAHVAVASAGVTAPGTLVAIIGTSTCHMVLGDELHQVPGMCGVVEDGILPGWYGYEAGQSCCGDHFDWFVRNCVPGRYEREAEERGISVHSLLTEKAAAEKPGESGLVALDWWNGNRSVLVDVDLTGLILGMNLQTKPEEIYRALLEATAYGTRVIVEAFRSSGVKVDALVATGGIAQKNPLMMQIYADVLRMPIRVCETKQGPALGAAVFGAAAAGSAAGGYDTIADAAAVMKSPLAAVYEPIAENADTYDKLYAEYLLLHDTFGRGENDVMKRLKALKKSL